MPNGRKIYQMDIKKQGLLLQDPLKFTQIWILGLKINHPATLDTRTSRSEQEDRQNEKGACWFN
jgi:hypothetical protein